MARSNEDASQKKRSVAPRKQTPPSERPTTARRSARTRCTATTDATEGDRSAPSSPGGNRADARASIEPGWHALSEAAYHADPCPSPSLSSHIAMTIITRSLAHAWRAHPRSPLFAPQAITPAIERGRAAHALVLGGPKLSFIEADDWRSKKAREERDLARGEGRIAVLARERDDLETMAAMATARLFQLHERAFATEKSALWRAPGGGWRRARLDSVSKDRLLIVDYKTTEATVDAHACERRIADHALQIQAAAYVDAIERLHPQLRGRIRFIFQWQEQKPPFALSPPIEMSEAFMSLGREQWRAAERLWDQALRHRAFPAYSRMPHHACPPPWELTRWEERLSSHPDWAPAREGEST